MDKHIPKTIEIKWGVSRGRDTEGYTTCSLYANGKRMAACNGGGYDLRGTVIGDWMAKEFSEELRGLSGRDGHGNGFYGLRFVKPRKNQIAADTYDTATSENATPEHTEIWLDGGCGESSMMHILQALGYTLRRTVDRKNLDVYELEAIEAK